MSLAVCVCVYNIDTYYLIIIKGLTHNLLVIYAGFYEFVCVGVWCLCRPGEGIDSLELEGHGVTRRMGAGNLHH